MRDRKLARRDTFLGALRTRSLSQKLTSQVCFGNARRSLGGHSLPGYSPKAGCLSILTPRISTSDGTALAAIQHTMMAGSLIGQYRVLGKLGEGGMGIVFEAVHEAIERHVAIKVLHAEYAKDPEFAKRFVNEARAVNRVDHPGLVQISDYGQLADGAAYIVMEYIKGETLRGRLQRTGGRLPTADAVKLSLQLADCLAAAHAEGIVHRDLKPENVMIIRSPRRGEGERTKLLDFGIAKLFEDSREHIKTRTNAVMGTPVYMSPEQCRGAGSVDDKSDVYSLGVMMYLMVAGQPPFSGEGLGEILGKHMYEDPPKLALLAKSTPAELAELIHRMLRKDKNQRPSMGEVAATLDSLGTQLVSQTAQRAPTEADAPTIHASLLASSGNLARFERLSTLGLSVGQTPSPQRRRILTMFGSAIALITVLALGGRVLLSSLEKRGQAHIGASRTVSPGLTLSPSPVLSGPQKKATAEVSVAAKQPATEQPPRAHESSAAAQGQAVPDHTASPEEPDGAANGPGKADRPQSKSREAAALVQKGRLKLRAGEHAAAAALFSLAVGLDARNGEALGGLGRASFAQGNFVAAVNYLSLAVELAPRRSVAYQELLAEALYEAKRYQDAADRCNLILTQVPGSISAKHTLLRAEEMLRGAKKPSPSAEDFTKSGAAAGLKDFPAPSRAAPPPPRPPPSAELLYYQGHYDEAVAVGLREARSGVLAAWRIVGMAACQARNGSAANDAYHAAAGAAREDIVAVCTAAGYKLINNALRLLD